MHEAIHAMDEASLALHEAIPEMLEATIAMHDLIYFPGAVDSVKN